MQVTKMTRITHAHNDDGDIESDDDDSDNKDSHAYTGYTMMAKKMGDKCVRMIGYFSSFFSKPADRTGTHTGAWSQPFPEKIYFQNESQGTFHVIVIK